MGVRRITVISMAYIVGLFATADSVAFAHPYFSECGVYAAIGRLDCESNRCQFTIFPQSRAEFSFEILPRSALYFDYSGVTISVRMTVASLSKFSAVIEDDVPLRALPSHHRDALRLLEAQRCRD